MSSSISVCRPLHGSDWTFQSTYCSQSCRAVNRREGQSSHRNGVVPGGAGCRAGQKPRAHAPKNCLAHTEVIGSVGGFASFPLNISNATDIENVAWNGPKIALAFANPKDVTIMDKSYQGRVNISQTNYSLCIRNLTVNDAGSYKAQINKNNSQVTTKEEFTLSVFEQLQEPKVTLLYVNQSSFNKCNVTLQCSVGGTENNVTYSWMPTQNGKSILFATYPGVNETYNCTVKNPVSTNTSKNIVPARFCSYALPTSSSTHLTIVLPLVTCFTCVGILCWWCFGKQYLRMFRFNCPAR
ncbi:membrane protein A33 [Aotine betaherpesvirus 1]|uniref:Membrane protein A33 n=1 Tax=Aotine betaherpesvirus 1 TaxID=50290 RepID=G8XUL0_9BETA|nr:membrane protein A33 [Aotine betaherpesvirus 1]AEV80852.1 membrane protein A33 [Aotine betaherpesvirus 1]